MFSISLPVQCSSAESYMYMHLYITESWCLLNCPRTIYAVIDMYSLHINYEDYSIFNLYSNVADQWIHVWLETINKTITKSLHKHGHQN